ncbi:MAG: sporulation integral membrane protein YtvI [Defluviitaleaceae bacterium]|nr:sporulation integral membrane protein YtvI [Defluviitaleaceae bacterium]
MQEFYRNNKVFIDKLLLLATIAAVVVAAVFVAGYIVPFVAGYIISLILSPLVGFLRNKFGIHRGISTAFLILGLLTGIFFLGYFLVGLVVAEAQNFTEDIYIYIETAQVILENAMISIQNMLGGVGFDIDFDVLLTQLWVLVTDLLRGFIQDGTFITAIPVAILRVIIAIVSAFFFIKDKELISESIARLFPKRLVARYRIVRHGLVRALVGYMKGQLIVMMLVSSVCIIGLLIIGSEYALLIGIGIGIFDLIPVFGAGGILITWAVYHFIAGNISFGIGLLVIYGVVFLTRQMLESHVVGEQIGIHPIILLMSVYVGIFTMGVVGIFAGPLIVVIVKTIMEANFTTYTEDVKVSTRQFVRKKR